MKDFIEKAKDEFVEFKELFDGKAFSEVESIATEKGLYFNADYGCELVDINYKSICATCVNESGMSRVSPYVSIYTKDGVWIDEYCFS